MKKRKKGSPGYLDYKKRMEILRAVIYFFIVAAIILLGYSQTHTKKNLLTVVGIVGCLPACKVLVGVITRWPYHSIAADKAKEITQKASLLTLAFDLVVTSTEKIMPIECVVISGNKIFGYVSNSKVDLNYAAKHIKTILNQNQYEGLTVKLFDQYSAFLARAEGLNNIQAIEKSDMKEYEEGIKNIILNISL